MFKLKGEDCSIRTITVTHAEANTITLVSCATDQHSLLYGMLPVLYTLIEYRYKNITHHI